MLDVLFYVSVYIIDPRGSRVQDPISDEDAASSWCLLWVLSFSVGTDEHSSYSNMEVAFYSMSSSEASLDLGSGKFFLVRSSYVTVWGSTFGRHL